MSATGAAAGRGRIGVGCVRVVAVRKATLLQRVVAAITVRWTAAAALRVAARRVAVAVTGGMVDQRDVSAAATAAHSRAITVHRVVVIRVEQCSHGGRGGLLRA